MNLNKCFEHVFIGKIQVKSSLIGCMNCDQPSEHPKSRDRPGDVPLELPRLSTGALTFNSFSLIATMVAVVPNLHYKSPF